MEPLLGDMPLIGALSVFFLKKPVSLFVCLCVCLFVVVYYMCLFIILHWLEQGVSSDVI